MRVFALILTIITFLLKQTLANKTILKLPKPTNESQPPGANIQPRDFTDFSSGPGPCSVSPVYTISFTNPSTTNDAINTFGTSLDLIITMPNCASPLAAAKGFKPPYPIVFMYNGFQSQASWYYLITTRLASWGYSIVQYNTPTLFTPTIAQEMGVFPPVLAFLKQQSTNQSSPLYSMIDASKVLVSGHSRGGKLAALIYAKNPQVKACWLIDPIDTSMFAPISEDNPSGVEAIKSSGRRVGLTGAGIMSSCNPTEGNYQAFYNAASPGSWLEFLPKASHSQFSDAGALNIAQDALCGSGNDNRTTIAELTATPILAWFWKELRDIGAGVAPYTNPLPSFFVWVKREEATKKMKFEVKGSPRSIEESLMKHDDMFLFKG